MKSNQIQINHANYKLLDDDRDSYVSKYKNQEIKKSPIVNNNISSNNFELNYNPINKGKKINNIEEEEKKSYDKIRNEKIKNNKVLEKKANSVTYFE